MTKYYTYIIRCSDNSLYTGITNDLERRMLEHRNKTKECAKYTKFHDFKRLEIYFISNSRSLASKLEYHIKKLKKEEKEEIINTKSLSILEEKLDILEYKNT